MKKKKTCTFDQWLDEIENFSTRRARLNEEVDFAAVMTGNLSHNLARRRMYDWLEAAYEVGYNAGWDRGARDGGLK
jgi:hypothetical protein